MAKYLFPAVFTPAEEGGYLVKFPDLSNVFTDGDSMEEAVENAADALNLMLFDEDPEKIPAPTPIEKVKAPEGGFVSLILADTVAYQEVYDRENNPIRYARKKAKLNIKYTDQTYDEFIKDLEKETKQEPKKATRKRKTANS